MWRLRAEPEDPPEDPHLHHTNAIISAVIFDVALSMDVVAILWTKVTLGHGKLFSFHDASTPN